MKIKIVAFFLVGLGLFSNAYGAGGSVVGNGAGSVENNFQFAYTSLKMTISECLAMMNCGMSSDENRILVNINDVIAKNVSNPDRLMFVSEKERPGFFETGLKEKHRIAKTGLTPDVPIFINVDMLYTSDGQPAIGFSTIVSILAHELGHQTGEKSHARLDIIGAKLRTVVMRKTTSHRVRSGRPLKSIEVMILNFDQPKAGSEVYLTWEGAGSLMLTSTIASALTCDTVGATVQNIDVGNGHFTFISEGSPTDEVNLGFGVWVHYFCRSRETLSPRARAIEFSVSKNLTAQVIDVRDL